MVNTADNDLLGQQHTNTITTDTVTHHRNIKGRRNEEDRKQRDTNTHKAVGTNGSRKRSLKLTTALTSVCVLYMAAIYCYIRIARNVIVPAALPPKHWRALLDTWRRSIVTEQNTNKHDTGATSGMTRWHYIGWETAPRSHVHTHTHKQMSNSTTDR